jgi:parallel beta-helix repeat protein
MKTAALISVAFGFVFMAMAGAPMRAEALNCGDTLPAGSGTVVLSADLNCSSTSGVRVTGPNTTLNMAGHRLFGGGSSGNGITLIGSGATLMNGSVDGWVIGVSVAGSGGHQISNMVSDFNSGGFVVESDGNAIVQSAASNNRLNGFNINGASNELDNDTARGNLSSGFQINGDSNVVKFSAAVANSFSPGGCGGGFIINGNRNRLSRNTSSGNCGHGFDIEFGADLNLFKENVASGSEAKKTTDLFLEADGFHVVGPEGLFEGNLAIDNRSGDGFNFDSGTALNEADNNTAIGNSYGISLRNTIFNTLTGNHLYSNSFDGIVIFTGTSNEITGNFALSNLSADLEDDEVFPCNNVWSGNTFGTALSIASCIH